MKFRTYEHESDDRTVKDICYNCGSPSMKKDYQYIRTLRYYSPQAFWCEVSEDNNAVYVASKCKSHVRLVIIAIRECAQGRRFGKEVLFRLLKRMSATGLKTLTFRTSMDESAQYFWLKMGARIMDVKGNDYEMQINIK